MVVWINNPFDFLPGEGARLERYALLSQALARAGHDVVWWSSDWSHLEKIWREVPDEAAVREELGLGPKDGRVEIRLLHTRPYLKNVSLARVRSHAAYAREWVRATGGLPRPDRILVSSPPLSLYRAARALAGGSVPVWLDVQDLWPEAFKLALPRGLRWTGRFLFVHWRRMAREAYRTADAVSVVSERYRAITGRGDAAYFPLGIRLPEARPLKTGATLSLCYIGNLGWAYRLEACIEAVRFLAAKGLDVELQVAGEGPQRLLFEHAQWEGVPVRFCGLLDAEEYDALLRRCDVGLVPMVSETGVGIPNKVCDYAAYGLAIVSGLGGESRQLIESYGAGLFYQAEQARSLARAIETLAGDRAGLAAMRRASRRMAEERFDAGRIYAAFARQIVASLPGRAR